MAVTQILVLCAGNIGRSPLAEVLLRKSLADGLGVAAPALDSAGVVVVSAGTEAPEGHAASARGISIAAEWGLDLTGHRATKLTKRALASADRIYGMDGAQLAAVTALVPEAASKTELLAGEGREILDPHYQDDEFFRDVAMQIKVAVAHRAAELVAIIHAGGTG